MPVRGGPPPPPAGRPTPPAGGGPGPGQGEVGEPPPLEDLFAARGPLELEDAAAGRGLPAPGFPHQPEGLPPPDRKAHAVHRPDPAEGLPEDPSTPDGEVL